MARPGTALYVGGMGARGQELLQRRRPRYGFETRPIEIQDLYLDGKKDEAAAKVPAEWLEKTNARRPASYIAERVGGLQGGRRHRAEREPRRA